MAQLSAATCDEGGGVFGGQRRAARVDGRTHHDQVFGDRLGRLRRARVEQDQFMPSEMARRPGSSGAVTRQTGAVATIDGRAWNFAAHAASAGRPDRHPRAPWRKST